MKTTTQTSGKEIDKYNYTTYTKDSTEIIVLRYNQEISSIDHYFAVCYGDTIVLLYHEDMEHIRDFLYKNSWEVKVLKRYLEYCYMLVNAQKRVP